jgi:hypothetical protein
MMKDLIQEGRKIQETFKKINEAGSSATFEDVTAALKKSRAKATVILSNQSNIEIIIGMNAPDDVYDQVFDSLEGAGINVGQPSPKIIVSGDSSVYSRNQYSKIERINGGHRNYK